MTVKRIVLIALFLFLADFFVACCHCDPQTIEYKRCELDVCNLQYNDAVPQPLMSDSVPAMDFGIQLLFSQNQNTCQLKGAGLFVSTAMACDCENDGKALDRYVSIEIYTIQDLDSIHPAGANVTDYFSVTNIPRDSTLAGYVAFANSDYPSYTYMESENINLILNTTPEYDRQHQFKIEATMNDGRVLSEVTDSVVLY